MKKTLAVLLSLLLLSGAFAAGWRACFLAMLRTAGFYIDGEMIIVDFGGEYNEVFAGDWKELIEKYAQG